MDSAQARLTLASTSPQRRAILEQLRIPFEAVAPDYVEHDPPDADVTRRADQSSDATSSTVTTRQRGRSGSSVGRRNRQKIVPCRWPPVSSQFDTPGS